ncbi:LruC domain-containing protein [uncultured Butyricimonas sp.]|uniref:LruC domain-containing protein n=1 Tax=uncultured Butyricimonas sp. TaxID=1268785 RepID=UPI0026DDBC86|nr:LruC domain-containing protein [uncultured Butyricimonas sp.]
MRNLLCCLVLGVLFTACHKDGPYKGGDKDLVVPLDFNWKTLERQDLKLDKPSSVYLVKNGEELLIGDGLEAGEYTFTTGIKGGELKVKSSAMAYSIARAPGDEVPNGHRMIYYPGEGYWASMMVEDIFPWLGDLDMNDVVFNFRLGYETISDNNNGKEVKSLTIWIKPVAMGGAAYKQVGLALNFVNKSMKHLAVNKVSGQVFMENEMFTLNKKGNEEGEEYIVPLIGNLYSCFGKEGGILNTDRNLPRFDAEEVVIKIEFSQKPKLTEIQLEPDNAGNMMDLFVTFGTRGKEVHVKGRPATAKMEPELLHHGNNRNFSSPENWVWALILDTPLKYPQESKAIYDAYPDFEKWVNGEAGFETQDEWSFNYNSDLVY